MIEESLREYGLGEKETRVYVSLLQTGLAPVHRIAEKSRIQRTTTYDVLKSLKEKGLVSFVEKDRKTFFEAVDPAKLISALREKENRIKQILPDLISMKESALEKPKVTVYEGKTGLVSILEDILKTKDDFLCLASKKALLRMLEFYFPNFVKRRVKLGIRAKLVLDAKPIVTEQTEYKIVNKRFNTATWIYAEKVAILSLTSREPMGVIIENKEIADSQRMMFDLIWGSA
ncbi:MAG: helix-turn-helix domain-containing protein [archaeon]